MRNLLISLLLIIFTAATAQGQIDKSVQAARFLEPPVIDGRVDEDVWQLAKPIEGFIQFEPEHGRPSPQRTIAYIGYGDEALYVAFICYDPEPEAIAAAITKRDGELDDDDAVVIMLDTFNDNNNCTYFTTNSLGTQADGKVADNGRSEDENWDATWLSAAARIPEGWTAEFAIPFRILKFQGGEGRTWGLNLGRYYPRHLEESYWAGPLESTFRVSQFGELTGLDLQGRIKRHEIIPYALSQAEEGQPLEGRAGLDLRYRLSSNLGADLTINPDFATVEADVEQINLTRYELRIAEKRPFFLEGAELFRQRIGQFYSRRIGDIPWGTKLTGKAGSWDLALIGTQSKLMNDDSSSSAATYTVVRAKKGVFGSSNIGFLATNRAYSGANQGSAGFDATLFFTETLGATAQFVRAHGPHNDGETAWFIRPAFDNATSHFHVRYSHWGNGLMENMNAVGFIRDDDRKEFDTNLSHTFWLRGRLVEEIDAGVNYKRYWSQKDPLKSWELDAKCDVTFISKWEIELSRYDEFCYEEDYRDRATTVGLGYDNRAGRSAQVSFGFGREENSNLRLFGTHATLKITDAWNVSYSLERSWLDPEPEDLDDRSTVIHVLRSNYYFSKDLYLKLFYQTHTAINKQNVQVVMVWRFLPPFGSLQVAYQRGTSRFGTESYQGHTLFTKLSWVL